MLLPSFERKLNLFDRHSAERTRCLAMVFKRIDSVWVLLSTAGACLLVEAASLLMNHP
jgi:hypothetical protein